ncbi:glycosyltransferase family 2 protein [uncultured Methanobrevibacter sp.]|uniref:glycosyltransferase family 2 protein n=1 Tax=uncultured Methanobrevibacter sp. TaxID=253161 RepID=UPI0025DCD95D|nr:glycosyltransferase family 2 protein [uncultured Methanobrevibacter sp.]
MELLSIIVPCYNEEKTVEIFFEELQKTLVGINYEVLFINDGSQDNTQEKIRKLADSNPNVKYISFSRNFGKESAIYAGLIISTGSLVGLIDADLQHPPSLLLEMIEAIHEGYDVAAAKRVSKKGEPVINKLGSRLFYRLFNSISSVKLVAGATDYRVMTRQVTDAVIRMNEYNRFSKGLFQWVGFETKWIEYENIQRVAGESTWSVGDLIRYSIKAIIAFTTLPLSLSIILGFIISALAFLYLLFIIVKYLLYSDPVQGFATTICAILFLGGMQMILIGILGKYLENTYNETKNRPIFIIKETNIDDKRLDKV